MVKFIQDEYHKIVQSKYITKLANRLHAKNLFVFNEHSVATGIAVGLGCAWIPMLFHTTIAVVIAILVDCNLAMVVAAIWFANPITMPIMYYVAYRVGEFIMGIHPPQVIQFHLSIHDMMTALDEIWQPFLLGCLICGLLCAALGYGVTRCVYKINSLFRR